MDGKKTLLLKNNEPRPDLLMKAIPSRTVKLDRTVHALTMLRLEVEHILHYGCANQKLASLPKMGNQVADILLKITRNFQAGNLCCSNCLERAVAAMRYFPQPQIQEWLINTSKNRQSSIGLRAQAILSLGHINSISSEKTLLEFLKNDPDAAIRKAAVYALHQNIKPGYFKMLAEHIKTEKSSGVRQQLIYVVRSMSKQFNLPVPDKFPAFSEIKASIKPSPILIKTKSKK